MGRPLGLAADHGVFGQDPRSHRAPGGQLFRRMQGAIEATVARVATGGDGGVGRGAAWIGR
ncbi:MAG: hypothetical protein AABZ12_06935, partial [Planctomycetota bacterium]